MKDNFINVIIVIRIQRTFNFKD